MGRKSSKQPKQPNAASLSDTTITTAVTTISKPTSTSLDDVHAPAETRLTFFTFITNATAQNIREFLKLAATTPEGENLMHLWSLAFEDGYERGRKSLLRSMEKNLEDRFEKGVEKGMNLG